MNTDTEVEETKPNKYYSFTRFVAFMVIFFIIADLLEPLLHPMMVHLVQAICLMLYFTYIDKLLAKRKFNLFTRFKIPLWLCYILFFIAYIVIGNIIN